MKVFIVVVVLIVGNLFYSLINSALYSPGVESEVLSTAENDEYIARHEISQYQDGHTESQVNIRSKSRTNKIVAFTLSKMEGGNSEISQISRTKLAWLNDEKPHLIVTLESPTQSFKINQTIRLDNVLVTINVHTPEDGKKY